tara:strand:+ start:757 stop:960 length:204 start_codon:yes stop_codon:yes gene_type:complete
MYWSIENSTSEEVGFESLSVAKRRARILMNRRVDKGEDYPFVQIIADDHSVSWHFDTRAGRWHEDTF